MKVLLADDEPLQLMRLEGAVKKVLGETAEICAFSNPLLAEKESKTTKFDLAFLDIEMPVLNGLQLAKKLKSQSPLVNIVFVTAYDHYALEAYKVHASGYLTKPVNEEKVQAEMDALRFPVELSHEKILQARCFGEFELFHDGAPLKFKYQKSKEVLAYLIDREGSAVNVNELNAVLWEEDHKSYFRNLIADIQATLREVGASEVFVKRHNECFVDISKIDCDAYEYHRNNPDAIRSYRGEYMSQYHWAALKIEY